MAAFREEEVLPRVGKTVFSQIVFLIAFFVAFNPKKNYNFAQVMNSSQKNGTKYELCRK